LIRRVARSTVVAVALVLTGCGGGASTDVLSQTANNLSKIRSGTLSMRFLVTPKSGSPFGFRLRGPFSFGKRGSLPLLRVAYTQIANGKSATVTIISTGSRAYVQAGGRTTQLTSAQADPLRNANGELNGKGGLGSLGVANWFENEKRSARGTVGGADTDKVTSTLNVVNAANDLLALLRRSGRDVGTIHGAEATKLDRATRASKIEVYSGKKDRLLRRLSINVDFGFDVPRTLRAALGNVVGARVRFDLGVDNPNRPVHVSAP
jgi:hypothetical protein